VIGIGMALSTAAAAADLDDSKPLMCTGLKGHDCHPGKAQCSVLKPEAKTTPAIRIDVAGKTIKMPYRTKLLSIQNTVVNDEQLELQGTALKFAWSAVVNRGSGKMTVTIAAREGAYVIFGQCKVADGT
jgi:hypothetical protein